ncbi:MULTISPECIES: NUDIX hydrolase [Actinoalloteichus]|uniref:NUDIX family protein n=1 Tax=Actinoalloteichus fjordicus TaxID=1612552 RepID=A0AAC9PPY2_9PSEU|nr:MULTISPECIES: NUDIX hydrolase [Actinoalloteichus]APU12336.1 NUDIX family protein [Actinoalloteichus fjordicus]APU18288.1 NUDIX family protein [Actinoalloteichus sp. GBA129-24]
MPELPKDFFLPAELMPDVVPSPPARPRDAATIVLVRDGQAGLEVFLLRRVTTMAFAAGMSVFPGGRVDPRDSDVSVAWAGPEPAWWAQRFGCSPELARAVVCAAVRETFEETGVLLAGPAADRLLADTSGYAEHRACLESRDLSLAEFLAEERLVLRADLLRPWANWVTPIVEPRRYDTRFLLAALPVGQRADWATSEADTGGWQRPADALRSWEAGEIALLPPTWYVLAELAECDSVETAFAAERTVDRIVPKIIRDGAVLRLLMPGDPDYGEDATTVETGSASAGGTVPR